MNRRNQKTYDQRMFLSLSPIFQTIILERVLIWLDTVVNSRPYYRCIVRQNMEGYPGFGGRGGIRLLRINEQDIRFRKSGKLEWSGAERFSWGAFFLPWWMLGSDIPNGGFQLFVLGDHHGNRKSVLIDDVPLCSMDDVIEKH